MKYLLYAFTVFILLFTFSCKSDDDNAESDPTAEICATVMQIPEVTISQTSFQPVENNNQRGYRLTAKITNNTSSTVNGEPKFIMNINGIPHTISGPGICGTIGANETCDYLFFDSRNAGENIDFGATLDCFAYEL
ncbi:MAG: hypothetical protein DWP94_04305 [Flavobacterium sp.]|nr:MAG: hypothetical protein DWP94_04305 [Flavobacterium sp.]